MTPDNLVALIGEDATFTLINLQAGQRIHIPRKVTPGLLDRLGGDVAAATALSAALGGEQVIVPLAAAWRIERLSERGLKPAQIASMVGRTYGHVIRYLASIRREKSEIAGAITRAA